MNALFAGRSTYDLGYVCPSFPKEDTKLSATEYFALAGGPALNAAVTYAALGGGARLASLVGAGPLADAVRYELTSYGVKLEDAAAAGACVLPTSSIIVNAQNGSRTIVNQEPEQLIGATPFAFLDSLPAPAIVLWDGHVPRLSKPILEWARARGAPTLMDGGGWKDWTDEFLPLIDIAIVSERFAPAGVAKGEDQIRALVQRGVRRGAITRGGQSMLWWDGDANGSLAPPRVEAIDTLGAGDIFHGAFAYYFTSGMDFVTSLIRASAIAAESCRYYGTRAWITGLKS